MAYQHALGQWNNLCYHHFTCVCCCTVTGVTVTRLNLIVIEHVDLHLLTLTTTTVIYYYDMLTTGCCVCQLITNPVSGIENELRKKVTLLIGIT